MAVKKHILVIDDEKSYCRMLETILSDSGYQVTFFSDSMSAVQAYEPGHFDLVITDVKMPNLDGLDVLQQLKEKDASIPVLMITAYATVEMSIQALRNGAFDMLTKPFEPEELLYRVRNALRQTELIEENKLLKEELADKEHFEQIVGRDPKLMTVLDTAHKVAKRDIPVIISGESGTGKELVAQAVHNLSPRKEHKFIAINCGALPDMILESELFGHCKGAFTGADKDKKGLLEMADRGTLLLDEVGNLPLKVQKTLLRFLQEKEFYKVGESSPTRVDVRILSATNADLRKQIEDGTFREDFYYRLAAVNLELPPLRERSSDIPLLVHFFITDHNDRFSTDFKGVEPRAMDAFFQYDWPGNVRELKNVIDAALSIEDKNRISLDSISRLIKVNENDIQPLTACQPDQSYAAALKQFESSFFTNLLALSKGNVEIAANKAKVNLATIYRKIKKYHLRS